MKHTLGNRFGPRLIATTIAAAASLTVALAAGSNKTWPPPGVSYFGGTKAPDISGLWLGTITGVPGEAFAPNRGSADGRPATYWAPWPLPYTPKYQKLNDERMEAARAGRAVGDYSAKCLPFGLPAMLVSKVYPDEIVQTPGQVTIFVYGTFPIMIWTDGRSHPKDLAPSFNGHSIGYWVGDTLFVDTTGILGQTTMDSTRHQHSPKLHLKWSIQKLAPDVLHVHVVLNDDEAFTEPVVTTNIWHRKSDPRWQILDDASCFENNHNEIDDTGAVGFKKF